MKGREENRERRAGAGVHKRGKVGVQLGPIRAGPHVPAGGGSGGPRGQEGAERAAERKC